ncbi:MAG: hypothetical protein KAH17_04040 [Bacteroidales bacterium]|nr:hypothetical protein [Bacteroidales bacterium]
MKKIFVKSIILCLIFASFALQASAPFAPSATSVTITDIPSSVRDDYRIKVRIDGKEIITGYDYVDDVYAYGSFSTSESFMAYHKFMEETTNHVIAYIWSQPVSGGAWTYHGGISSADGDNKSFGDDDWLIHCDLDWDDMVIPN